METVQHGFIVVDSPRGNDATARRDSWSKPFATLSRAFPFIEDNDTVLIYPGPYLETPREPLDIAEMPGGGAPLWIKNRRNVTLRGLGLPEIWFAAHGNGLTIESCVNVTIEGIQFRGAGILTEPQPYYFALLMLHGVNEFIRVRDCVFTQSGNHGIAHLLGPRTTTNSLIENCRFSIGGHMNQPNLGRDGAAIAIGGAGNVIRNNLIEQWLRGMEYESGDFPGRNAPTSRNVFSHNKILNCWWQHMLITPIHQKAELFDQILIENNIIQGWGMKPPQTFDPKTEFQHEGIYFTGGINAQIRGNAISDMWGGGGMRIAAEWSDVRDLLVSENRVWNVDLTGISALAVQRTAPAPSYNLIRCRLTNNKVGPCGGRGIWIRGDYNVVESNDVHLCGSSQLWEGLYVDQGKRNIFRRNRLIDCLPPADLANETLMADNDHYWDTKRPPR